MDESLHPFLLIAWPPFVGETIDTNQAIRVWDLAANRERIGFVTPGHASMLRCLRFSPDNRLLASGGWDGL